jgi:hypothetical protein
MESGRCETVLAFNRMQKGQRKAPDFFVNVKVIYAF